MKGLDKLLDNTLIKIRDYQETFVKLKNSSVKIFMR